MNILLFFPFAMIFAFDCSQFPGTFFSTGVGFGIEFSPEWGFFLFCARSENSDTSRSRYENSEKIVSAKSKKLGDRDRDKNIPKKSWVENLIFQGLRFIFSGYPQNPKKHFYRLETKKTAKINLKINL